MLALENAIRDVAEVPGYDPDYYKDAIHQIAANPGGGVLDIGNSEMPLPEISEIVLNRLRRSSPFDCDVLLIQSGQVEEM